jgi:UDP-glucose 4-epimerase
MSRHERSDDISACLRYFSAYGVKPEDDAGEQNLPPWSLILMRMRTSQAMTGREATSHP